MSLDKAFLISKDKTPQPNRINRRNDRSIIIHYNIYYKFHFTYLLAYFFQLFLTSLRIRLLFSSVISPLFSRAFSLQLLFGSLSPSFSLTSFSRLSFILCSTSPLSCYCLSLNFSSLLGTLSPFFPVFSLFLCLFPPGLFTSRKFKIAF